jgi:tol-pal system protein YbgF
VRQLLPLLALGAAACATSAQMKQLDTQVGTLRAELARRDSAQLDELRAIGARQQQVADSLVTMRRALASVRGDFQNELYGIQQQLLQLQELTGQSQRRLTELRSQLEARGEQIGAQPGASPAVPAPAGADSGTAAAPDAPAPASAQQMYDASMQQLRRGSVTTARAGLRELVQVHPQSELVPDALYFIGQSFAAESPDSASAYYQQVVDQHAKAKRAAAALYNLGLLAERRKDAAAAKESYTRVTRDYPRSDEAALARDRLRALGGR